MRGRRAAAAASFALGAAIVGCGGGSGQRSATVVAGNVRSVATAARLEHRSRLWRIVRGWWSASAEAQVPGVTVAIVGTSTTDQSDAQGFFRLEGNEFGPVGIQFTSQTATATLFVTLPGGGELDLINVDLKPGKVTVEEQRLRFDGPITGTDCQGSLLQVLSGSLVPFRVRIGPATALFDQNGHALACQDIGPAQPANVQGTVNDDGTIAATSIQVNPAPAVTPTPASVEGTVAALDCPADITINRSGSLLEVDINSGTQIREQSGSALQCTDLAAGDIVRVAGDQTSFGIEASVIERLPPPTPTPTPGATPTRTP